MTTIPFAEALKLLDRAHDIHVPGYSETKSFSLDTAEGASAFLDLDLEEGANEFYFQFRESDNQTVKVSGGVMTLVYADVVDDSPPEIEIKLMVPLIIETPPLVLKALRHVRAHLPEVDRVVFWGDGRWSFLTDNLGSPTFLGLIDISLLKDAANEVGDGHPHAFQLPSEEA